MRVAGCVAVLSSALALSACSYISSSGAEPTAPTSGTVATTPALTAPPTTAMSFEPGATVPVVADSTDLIGCLDEAGTARAPAGAWYRSGAPGVLSFTGEFVTTGDFDDFARTVDGAVSGHVDGFTASGASELAPNTSSCVTYRSVTLARDDGAAIVVAAWRLQGVADPFWIPNDSAFVVRDEATLVSDSPLMRIALVVAPDGTTVRVSAYGSGSLQRISGWPTTTPPSTNVVLGASPATVDQVVAIGADVLGDTLQR